MAKSAELEQMMAAVVHVLHEAGKPLRFTQIESRVLGPLRHSYKQVQRLDLVCQKLRKAGRIESVKQHWQFTAQESQEQKLDQRMDAAAEAAGMQVFKRPDAP